MSWMRFAAYTFLSRSDTQWIRRRRLRGATLWLVRPVPAYESTPMSAANVPYTGDVVNNERSGPSLGIIDNDPITLGVLRSMLGRLGFDVAWVARTGREAIARCDEEPTPDVVLVDMSLPDMEGTEVCRVVRTLDNDTPLLAVTSYPLECYAEQAAECGAQGIVGKTDVRRIAAAARAVASGRVLPSPPGCPGAVFGSPQACREFDRRSDGVAPLGSREVQILELALRGYEQDEMSDRLGIAAATVRTYTRRAREKLHCRTLAQATAVWSRLRWTFPYASMMREPKGGAGGRSK